MILELDLGNSRIKWRLLDDSGVKDQGAVTDLIELKAELSHKRGIKHCRICSVRRGEALSELGVWIQDNFAISPQIAEVSSRCGAVSNRYQDPSRLGVDRWLAMLAAYERTQGACIIIDGGTALTLDVLDSEGLHQGGFILPGLALMARSLEENTAIKLSSQGQVPSIVLGHSTDQAVRNGILATVIALIEKLYKDQLEGAGRRVRLVLTGGDAATLSATLAHSGFVLRAVAGEAVQAEIIKDLVLDGLALACPADGVE
ncbi:MAG: type III pantothenate kinase [Pseudohongiellaceae bacterium]|jgi:type III pantothenate kinase